MNGLFAVKNSLVHARRLWILIGAMVIIVAMLAVVLLRPTIGSQQDNQGLASPTWEAVQSPTGSSSIPAAAVAEPVEPVVSQGEPETLDFKAYAEVTAKALYTWDSRTSTYTDVYSHVRSWWLVLADGSNPLTVYTHEFEGTGINAAAFTQLTSYKAYRTASIAQSSCDEQLAQVRDHPTPWVGLHVCTVTLNVRDWSTTAPHGNAYRVPVSVMVNCPPATTAPTNRCVLVGFVTTAYRIVY